MSDFKIEFIYDSFALIIKPFTWFIKPEINDTYSSRNLDFLCFRFVYPKSNKNA